MSGLMESHCPNFWKAAPARCMQARMVSSHTSRNRWFSGKITTTEDTQKSGVNTHASHAVRLQVNHAL